MLLTLNSFGIDELDQQSYSDYELFIIVINKK